MSTDPALPPLPPSTIVDEFVSGLFGMGIALGCLLPPIVHLVTGPLGPLIGGLFAASRAKPGGRGQAVIALTIATGFATLVGGVLLALIASSGRKQLPDWLPSQGTTVALAVGAVFTYAGMLATLGVFIGSGAASKESPKG